MLKSIIYDKKKNESLNHSNIVAGIQTFNSLE